MTLRLLVTFTLFHLTYASQKPFWINDESTQDNWDDLGPLEQKDDEISTAFAGITTFAHLPFINCLHPVYAEESKEKFDIAIVGAPFDTSVTYRPGYVFFHARGESGVIVELDLDLLG
jgi:hypothetical protein